MLVICYLENLYNLVNAYQKLPEEAFDPRIEVLNNVREVSVVCVMIDRHIY